jgi:hypothetical protein
MTKLLSFTSLVVMLGLSAISEGKMSGPEKLKLKVGETKALKSGLQLKLKDTEFESRQITKPGISAPATTRFTIILEAVYKGAEEILYFVPDSPGTVSNEENNFQRFTIRYVSHSYDSKQVMTAEFSISEKAR